MPLPNFFMIGAAKCGTTAITEYLKQHPQVFISPRKEPFYFMLNDQPPTYAGPGDLDVIEPMAVHDWAAYQALFDGVRDEIAIGEATTHYLYVPEAAERIHQVAPDAKIIVFLRQPVERAYSSLMHMVRDDREPHDDFEQALTDEAQRIRDNWEPIWHYASASYYHDGLKRYYDLFGPDQIAVYLFDDLKADSEGLIRSIYRFLGVDEGFTPDTSIRYNVSGVPKNRALHAVQTALLSRDNPVKKMIKPLLPKRMRHAALHGVVGQIRQRNFEKRHLDPALAHRLLDSYRDDILKTQALIGRDLSHWFAD